MIEIRLSVADLQQLQAETSQTETEQRLRAIAAERRVRELEAEIATLKAPKENPDGTIGTVSE